MLLPRFVVSMVSIAMMVLGTGVASGQTFPSKPIRIVASEVGGGTDFAARIIGPGLAANLGQQVVVDNRPSGVILGEIVSKAPPDGHTLLLTGSSFWIGSLLRKTPYDVVKDFSPVTLAQIAPNLVVVHPSLPVKSVKELIALAKARPEQLNYGTSGTGSSNHLAGELLMAMTGVKFVRINYKGAGPAVNDLVGGQVQLMFATAGSVTPHIKSGRVRALAVTTPKPSAVFPDLPTVAASVPGYESASLTGIFAPAGTPAAIINRLNQEIVRVLNQADVKERFQNSGSEAVGTSPEELATTMKSEMTRLGKVIKDAGIRAD